MTTSTEQATYAEYHQAVDESTENYYQGEPKIRPPYSRKRSPTIVIGISTTDTSLGNDTDVNRIVARFERTGYIPTVTIPPTYMDCTEFQGDITDLLNQAAQTIETAQQFASTWQPPEPTPTPTHTPTPTITP